MMKNWNFKCSVTLFMAVSVALLAGCAANKPHKLDLAKNDTIEEGLSGLERTMREHPESMESRADYIRERDRAINFMLQMADRMREQGRAAEATDFYRRVLSIDSANAQAKDGIKAIEMDVHHSALLEAARALYEKGDLEGAQAKLQGIFVENPDHVEALSLLHDIQDKQASNSQMATPTLKSKFKQPISLQFRDANLKMVFEALSRTSGINVLLDRDVKNDLKTTIFVKDSSVEDAIDLILMQNQLGKKVLSDNTVFIYPGTPAKIKEYQDLVIRTFNLTNADAKQMQTLIKTMLKTKDIFVHEKTNSLIIRDTPEAIQLAEKLIAAQDVNEPEVMLEVEVLEVLNSKLTELGIKWPDQLGLSVTGIAATTTTTTTSGGAVVTNNVPAQSLTVENLRKLKSGSINVTPLNMYLNLKKEVGESNLLASPRIRVKQHEKAKIMIGDRVPVITNSVTPVSTGTPVVTGNVQYLDVGLKLEVEPDIHIDGEVSIKTFLEVSNIASQVTNASSGTVAYQIGTRNTNTVLRLKDGETQVLAGLINDEDRKSSTRVPGLGDLPILGRLFSDHTNDKRKTEIILSITPHIIRNNKRADADLAQFWSGTDENLRSRPMSLQAVGSTVKTGGGSVAPTPTAAPAPRPAATPATPTAPSTVAPPPAPDSAATPATAAPVPGRLLPGVKPAVAPLILFWQGASQGKVGDEIKITVNAQTGGKVVSVPFKVSYDAASLELIDVAEGDFLKANNAQTTINSTIDQVAGQVSVELSQPGQQGAAGRGSLAVLTFKVKGANPSAPISITGSATNAAGDAVQINLPAPRNLALVP